MNIAVQHPGLLARETALEHSVVAKEGGLGVLPLACTNHTIFSMGFKKHIPDTFPNLLVLHPFKTKSKYCTCILFSRFIFSGSSLIPKSGLVHGVEWRRSKLCYSRVLRNPLRNPSSCPLGIAHHQSSATPLTSFTAMVTTLTKITGFLMFY